MDGKANRKYPDFDSLLDGQFLYLLEVGYEHDLDGPNEAWLRLTYSYLDVRDGESPGNGPGHALIVSFMKRFEDSWAVSGRWSKSFDRLSSDYREQFSIGGLWLKPFGRSHDFFGFGAFVGVPSDAARGNESGFELNYRLQVTQAVNITPHLQYWNRVDDIGPGADTWIGGIRFTFEY